MMIVEDTKEVWVAWTNTDLTEGRGSRVPKAVCSMRATAVRLGRKGGVQGLDCDVDKGVAVRVDGQWLIPGKIETPNKEDTREQERLDNIDAAILKAREAGLSDKDIATLLTFTNHQGVTV